MNIVFKKKQLRLIEDALSDTSSSNSLNNKKPALDVSNSEGDNDPSSMQRDISNTNQYNSGKNPINIDTQSYTNKKLPTGNTGSEMMTFKNTPQSVSQIQQMINTSPAQTLPKKIRLQNSFKRNGKLVEVTTFKKKELDKFLETI